MTPRRRGSLALAGTLALPWFVASRAALAHPALGPVPAVPDGMGGLAAGLLHPLGGADHWSAMVAVGMIAAARGGAAAWVVPAAFLGAMALGGGIGTAIVGGGIPLTLVETAVAASLAAFALLLLVGRKLSTGALAVVVAPFALFHGLAHAAERPETASGLLYGLGFLTATALLHVGGLGLGRAARTVPSPRLAPRRPARHAAVRQRHTG